MKSSVACAFLLFLAVECSEVINKVPNLMSVEEAFLSRSKLRHHFEATASSPPSKIRVYVAPYGATEDKAWVESQTPYWSLGAPVYDIHSTVLRITIENDVDFETTFEGRPLSAALASSSGAYTVINMHLFMIS